MNGSYPTFHSAYSHEELVEHFLLTPAELTLVLSCRGEANRCGMALLLKTINYLGYVPDGLAPVPGEIRAFLANQLGLLWDRSESYAWTSRTRDQHLALIRQYTGWRPPTGGDKMVLETWLRTQAAYSAHTSELLFDAACQWLSEQRVELPAEAELRRLVNAALSGFYQDLHQAVADSFSPELHERIDCLLIVPATEITSPFEGLKADPGKTGVENFQAEVEKLQIIRAFELDSPIL